MDQPDGDRLCWDWNPGRSVDKTAVAPSDLTQTWSDLPSGGRRIPTSGRPSADDQPSTLSELAGPIAAFTLHPPYDPATIAPDATIGVFGLDAETPPDADALGPDCGEVGRVAQAQPISFPEPGEGIAGFRLLSELGRGTFGRVFLAEESLLGNRLVALKVTRAEGDEPRILARLQHTNIVPIHSVHDDPRTRLRVMCMPYVGGANLAQVLEAAAVAHGTHADQRSLLRALDIVGLPPPSESIAATGPRRRRSTTSAAASGQSDVGLDLGPGAAGAASSASRRSEVSSRRDGMPAGQGSLARWPLLSQLPWWSRSIASMQRSWPRGKEPSGNERDSVQPARRFLREANFVRSAAWIVARLAEGLEHAHSHGLLHRDLKPSNILIAADGTPMLLDFNLAADSSIKANEEDKVRMGGTLPYMSPEHLDAFHPNGTTSPERVDERSDIYALGLILFEMIAGQRPFAEPDTSQPVLETIRAMIVERRQGAQSIRVINPSVPPDLDAVVRKTLHPDPDRRHMRAGDLAEDLRRFLDDLPLKHTSEPTLRGRVSKWVRRNPRATGASTVGMVGLTLIIGLSVAAWSVGRHLTQASVRLRLNGFQKRFPECQFLLNTVGGPTESLGRGITLAEETLTQAGITLDPDDPDAGGGWLDHLPLAERFEAQRDLAEVILLLARARVYLADRTHSAAEQRRAATLAVAWLDRAEMIDPTPNLTLYDDRVTYLDRVDQPVRSARDRARRAALSPRTGRDYYLLGTSLLAHGEPDQAEAALIKATGLSPQGFWPWFALGLCHYDQKRYTESAGDFAVCSVLSPRFAWPWMNRGLALAQVGRLIEARSAYDHAIAADPTMVDALANRGLVALELDDTTAAVADLERAISLGLRDQNIRAALGEALGRAGRRDEAIQLLDDLIRRNPNATLPRIARGTLLTDADPDRAEADFQHVLDLSPQHSGAYLGLAHLKRRKQPAEALRDAAQALKLDPNRIAAVELIALLRGRLGDRAVVEDVEILARHPTGHRLYNAACSLGLYVNKHPDPVLSEQAVGYLRRAISYGIAANQVRDDPDLASLRDVPAFRDLLAQHPGSRAPKPR